MATSTYDDEGIQERLNGPHYPLRVQEQHAELAKKAVAWTQRDTDELHFDAEFTKEDMQTVRQAFGTITGDGYPRDMWRTVFLTPTEFEAFKHCLVSYELDSPKSPSGPAWESLDSETHYWWDREPVEGDITAEEYRDGLREIADTYEGWQLKNDPADDKLGEDATLWYDGRAEPVHGVVEISAGTAGTDRYQVSAFIREGEEPDFSADMAIHPHRHAALREVREFFQFASGRDDVPPWVANEIEADESDQEEERTEPYEIEFGSQDAANAVRDEYEEHLCSQDDKRFKTVTLTASTPPEVVEKVEVEAADSRGDRIRSQTLELTDEERDRVSEAGGFTQRATIKNWESAKGTFDREGLLDHWIDAIPALADYDDPIEGAEEWVERNRDAGLKGGRRDEGHEDIKEEQRMQDYAQTYEKEACNHAEGRCKDGEPEACEFLQEECGYSEEEAHQILEDTRELETEQTELVEVGEGNDTMEVPPEVAGALRKSWNGYRQATREISDALETIKEEIAHAQRAWKAISAIRERNGQESENPRNLNELMQSLEAMPGNIPEATTLDEFRSDEQPEAVEAEQGIGMEPHGDRRIQADQAIGMQDTPGEQLSDFTESGNVVSSSEFAAESQGTLNVGVESTETAEEKQVTLFGEDEATGETAVPGRWTNRVEGVRYEAGPVKLERDGAEIYVTDPAGTTKKVATGMDVDDAQSLISTIAEMLNPRDIDNHNKRHATMTEAINEARKEYVHNDGNHQSLTDFGTQQPDSPSVPDQTSSKFDAYLSGKSQTHPPVKPEDHIPHPEDTDDMDEKARRRQLLREQRSLDVHPDERIGGNR